MYFLRKRGELEELKARSTNKTITEKEAQGCSYLQAIIKETVRFFPVIGLNLPRVVPKRGLSLAGRFFPEGTIVGINSWVGCTRQSLRFWSRRGRL